MRQSPHELHNEELRRLVSCNNDFLFCQALANSVNIQIDAFIHTLRGDKHRKSRLCQLLYFSQQIRLFIC